MMTTIILIVLPKKGGGNTIYQQKTFEQTVTTIVAGIGLVAVAWLLAFLPVKELLLIVGGTGGLISLLRWPWLIWPLLALLLPVTSSIKLGPLSATDGLLLAAIVLWFLDGVRRRSLRLQGSSLLIILAIYIISLILSLWGARNFVEGGGEVVKWLEFGVVLLLVRAMLPQRYAPWLVVALLAAAIGQSLLGLYQFIFQVGPEWFILFGRFMRASGTFAQPNPYAGYLGLTLPVVASLFLWAMGQWWAGRTPDETSVSYFRPLWWTFIAGISTALIGIGLLVSWSRGGWLGAIAGIGVVLFLRSRKTMIAGGLVTLLALTMLLLGALGPELVPETVAVRAQGVPRYLGFSGDNFQSILNEPVTDENFAILERIAHWVVAIRLWESAPWFGIGPGNYATLYPEIIQRDARLQRWGDPLGHAHNIYLNVLAEGGLIGIGIYLLFWFGIILWVWRGQKEGWAEKRWQKGWYNALALGILGVLAHLMVHNLFDNLFVQGIYIHLALWLALLHLPALDNAIKEGSTPDRIHYSIRL